MLSYPCSIFGTRHLERRQKMSATNNSLVGIRIRVRRRQLKISQNNLAETTGLSVPYISLVENGKKNPSLHAIMKISKSLDLSLDYLLGLSSSDPRRLQSEVSKLLADCSESEQKLLLDFLQVTKSLLAEYGHGASE